MTASALTVYQQALAKRAPELNPLHMETLAMTNRTIRYTDAALTHFDRAALIQGGIVIEHNKATLAAVWHADPSTGATEGRFVMEGPSGRHTLLIAATDTERLAAHWRVFCEHEANR